ncbi:unnamed protein product [Linum trigynum]|uniref:S1 motif domain-containing protein n=1 Tax=Linum trigynum TaxID=586398 RepID=A0AAV2GH74_9ROSI
MPPFLQLHHFQLQPCNSLSLPPLECSACFLQRFPRSTHANKRFESPPPPPSFHFFSLSRHTHIRFCSRNEFLEKISGTQLPESPQTDELEDNEELELHDKPSPVTTTTADDNGAPSEEVDDEEVRKRDEVLAPFLKFFKPRDGSGEVIGDEISDLGDGVEKKEGEIGNKKLVTVEYYEPKAGEFVVGVVVSGNENKLDVNIGADLLGTMLTKEVMPLCGKEMEGLLCDLEDEEDCEEFLRKGKIGIVKDEIALSGGTGIGRPVVETGTVLFAEVLGRTLSGRPLLSTRRLFRRIAWHRARQIKELNAPIEVKITEWNTGGLLTRIEGLRAFLPKIELVRRVNNFKELKENVGRRMNVLITRINESNNDLILSEKEAWEMLNLQEGTLLEGTIKTIFPYGAQVRIGESNRSGLLHISKISAARVTAVEDVLKTDEKVKVLVAKSMFPGKISLSTADLESEPGLFLSDRERVFAEAEDMARKYRQKLPASPKSQKSATPPTNSSSFDNEPILYANWKWLKFEREFEEE